MDLYSQIFKRKSFHLFSGDLKISEDELDKIKEFIKNVKPLEEGINFDIEIVKENETTCHRGGEYCLLFYSEVKGEYLRNIGYIGQQIDLFLPSLNIGSLWFGIGKPKKVRNDLEYVIMISIKKMPEDGFRKDMFKSKRKALDEIWSGEDLNIGNIVRFSPSACNLQPWYVENNNEELLVYRHRDPSKRGIIPIKKILYYNQIDIGIFIYLLEVCLEHEHIKYERTLVNDLNDLSISNTLISRYKLIKEAK